MRTVTLTLIIAQAMLSTSLAQVPTAGNLGLKDTEFVVRLNSPIRQKNLWVSSGSGSLPRE